MKELEATIGSMQAKDMRDRESKAQLQAQAEKKAAAENEAMEVAEQKANEAEEKARLQATAEKEAEKLAEQKAKKVGEEVRLKTETEAKAVAELAKKRAQAAESKIEALEKEKRERQAGQAKQKETASLALEAEAIALVSSTGPFDAFIYNYSYFLPFLTLRIDQTKAMTGKEAAQTAKRRKAEEEAAKFTRKKASDMFNFFAGSGERKVDSSAAVNMNNTSASKEELTSSSKDQSPLLVLFAGDSQGENEASVISKQNVTAPQQESSSANDEQSLLLSFFGGGTQGAVDRSTSTPNFLSFLVGNNKDKSDSPPATETGSESPASKTVSSEDKSPLLNFFVGGTQEKSESAALTKVSGGKSPSPPASSTFSFFGGSKDNSTKSKGTASSAKPQKPRPSIAIKKAGGDSTASSFSFFGGTSKKEDASAKATTVPVSVQSDAKPSANAPPAVTSKKAEGKTPPPTFSFFGGSKQANSTAADSTFSALPKNIRPTVSIKKAKEPVVIQPNKVIQAKKSEDKVPRVIKRATFSLSPWLDGIVEAVTGTKTLPSDAIPVLEKWNQNADGSITGVVSNSLTYQDGASITTSPVKKDAKSGTIVTTSSGSQYRLLDFYKSKVRKEVPVVVGDKIPLLSDWSAKSDGSLTGFVSNSKAFKSGTEITTSRIKRGTQAPGSIVITQSGKQYRLGNKRSR
jgi:hypothetical protein